MHRHLSILLSTLLLSACSDVLPIKSADDVQVVIDNAQARVTKKPFGIFITPETSPVQPEKFKGYHTGVDFELLEGEKEQDVAVRALCDGDVVLKEKISGYGGVLIQECLKYGKTYTVLYGHLSLASVQLSVGDMVEVGQYIGHLGRGYSEETDGERPHLHLSIHIGSDIELRGYVTSEMELAEWVDVMEL